MDDLRFFQDVHGSPGYGWSCAACGRDSETCGLSVCTSLSVDHATIHWYSVKLLFPFFFADGCQVLVSALHFVVKAVAKLACMLRNDNASFCVHRSKCRLSSFPPALKVVLSLAHIGCCK
jgi:hypothetical protein